MKRVAILTSYGGQIFDPVKGMDGYGSELAVYEVMRRLSKFHDISIFISKPKGFEIKRWGITWRSSADWDDFNPPDVIIILRYMNIFLDYYLPPQSKIMMWFHDDYPLPQWNGIYINPNLMRNVEPFVDQWIAVGTSQILERLSPGWGINMDKTTVIKNGITLEKDFDSLTSKRKPLSFVYSSCPNRGLWNLLSKWNKIKAKFPEATLTIFYKKTDETNKKFEPYENDPSINYVGKVEQKVLFEKLKETDYWLYPTKFFETCCTTAIEMAYYGPITITSTVGALKENVKEKKIHHDPYSDEFIDEALEYIESLENDSKKKQEVRRLQFEWAKEQTWDHRIPQWQKLLE
jgi:glycosyltransferase involved in cell wall biosynthesis